MPKFESKFDIGDPVYLPAIDLRGHIRAVTFSAGKVRYAVYIGVGKADAAGDPELCYTLHNLDSAMFEADDLPSAYKIKFDHDNYAA